MKPTLLIFLATLFVGCASYNVQLYGSVDQTNKTVTVPAGSGGLKGELKKALYQGGWKLVIHRGPSVTEGELGKKTKIEQYDTFNTKYHLIVTSQQVGTCLNFGFPPSIFYDISFIDNDSGTEVFTIDGRGCESTVVKKFENILSSIDK